MSAARTTAVLRFTFFIGTLGLGPIALRSSRALRLVCMQRRDGQGTGRHVYQVSPAIPDPDADRPPIERDVEQQ